MERHACLRPLELLKPATNDKLQKWPVSKRVNKPGNDEDAELIARLAA